MQVYHASIEGAQHTPKGLDKFLKFAKEAGAAGCQPSNFMLDDGKGGFLSAAVVRQKFADACLKLDGISAHCPIWVHGTVWTGSPTVRPFIPVDVAKMGQVDIQEWAEDYILKLLDLCAELKVGVVPMFWGTLFGWEMATGYMWGFWQGPGYDLVAEGKDRFVQKTQRIRDHARKLGIVLGHEIHPGTAAMCADDFMMLLDICDDDVSLGVNIDPSHCWEGESWQDRFSIVGERCVACHVKNHVIRKGFPLRCMESDWRFRGMQFTDLKTGDINLPRFVEAVTADTDYAQNYRQAMHLQSGDTVPLVVEAESAHRELDKTSADGVAYVRDELCIDVAAGSFEDGMGADKQ